MISYLDLEILLKECKDLMLYAESYEDYNEDLLKAIRKIVIANEFMGKGVICVSGRQGAGKTTLMKNFYGIDNEVMNESLGRGERIPVFISERAGIDGVELNGVFLEKVNDKYDKAIKKLDKDSFQIATKGGVDYSNLMYLQMFVPFRHFNTEEVVFMLLPGFEGQSNYWESLVDFSVKCAHSAVFVFSDSDFASFENAELVKKIKTTFGENVIYALSRSDESEDDNEGLANNVKEKLSVQDDSRIVRVGDYNDKAKNDQWIEWLTDSIDKNCKSLDTIKQNQKEYILKVIKHDLYPVLMNIKKEIEDAEVDGILEELDNNEVIKQFERVMENRGKQLKKDLKRKMQEAGSQSVKVLQKLYSDSDYAKSLGAHQSILSKLRRKFFGNKPDDLIFQEERIKKTLFDREKGICFYQKALVDALVELSNTSQDKLVERVEKYLPQQDDTAVSEYDNQSNNTELLNLFHDAAVLLSNDNIGNVPKMNQHNLKATMNVIADLSVSYLANSLQHKMHEENGIIKEVEISEEMLNLYSNLNVDQKKVVDNLSSVQKATFGFLGVTGVDILSDGVLDGVPALAEALGVSVPVVGVAVGFVVVATEGMALIKDINRLDTINYNNEKRAIEEFYKEEFKNCMEIFYDAKDKIHERLVENLALMTTDDKKIIKRINAKNSFNNIEKKLMEINDIVSEDLYDLSNMFA